MIHIESVSGGYSSQRVIHDVSFQVKRKELFGLIGPNGSGKTTLLKMMSQILPIEQGKITLKGQAIEKYTPKQLAQLVAVLPQQTEQTFSYTVRETVSLGRYAHQRGIFRSLTKTDEAMIQRVMEQTGVSKYEHVPIDFLSGGERQRVFLAQALAQDPAILLLDEPTNHLDLAYQKELLDVLKQWTIEDELTVVAIFHDLNLASLYCDRLLLLDEGKRSVWGTPDEVLKKSHIEKIYGAEIESHPHPKVPKPQMMLVPEKQREEGCTINAELLHITEKEVSLQAPQPLKTMSSGVTGSGVGWYKTFVNRHVDSAYDCEDHVADMEKYLKNNAYDVNDTVSMMTAVRLKDAVYKFAPFEDLSVFVVVTAGVGNAVDASLGKNRLQDVVGTINTWIFVNGYLSDEAFIQSLMTASEAKAKVLQDLAVVDPLTDTVATGTSTDSLLVAATQQGKIQSYGGSVTPLGRLVGKTVYDVTKQAIQCYLRRRDL